MHEREPEGRQGAAVGLVTGPRDDGDPVPRRLLTTFDVAALVGCHEETVRRAYLCGELRRLRFGVRSCRLLADGVDIRIIQLMLSHASVKQTQRYLNITDEELRRAMTGVWERRRQLRLSASSGRPGADDLKASGQ